MLVMATIGVVGGATATDFTWLNTPASANWNEADENWSGGGSVWVNDAANSAVFGASGTKSLTVGAITAKDITFSASGYVLSGGTLDVNGTLFISNDVAVTFEPQASYTQTVNGVILGAGKSWLAKRGTGTLELNPGAGRTNSVSTLNIGAGAVSHLGGTTLVTTNDPGNTSGIGLYANVGKLWVNGGVVKTTGAGYVITTGYGELHVKDGLLDLSSSNELLNGYNGRGYTYVHTNGVLDVNRLRVSQANVSSAGQQVVVEPGGTLMLTYFYLEPGFTFTSGNGGRIYLVGGTVVAKMSTTSFLGTTAANWTYVTVYIGSGVAFDSNGYDITIQKRLITYSTYSGGVAKRGAGTLTFNSTAAHTYLGVTSVEEGTLKLGANSQLPAAGVVEVFSNAVFDVNGKAQTVGSIKGSGRVNNCGSLTVSTQTAPGGADAFGTLTFGAVPVSLGGTLAIDVGDNGACDRLHVEGNLNVSGLALSIADTAPLNRHNTYVIATCTGELSGSFSSVTPLPSQWVLEKDTVNKRIYLHYRGGLLIKVL